MESPGPDSLAEGQWVVRTSAKYSPMQVEETTLTEEEVRQGLLSGQIDADRSLFCRSTEG